MKPKRIERMTITPWPESMSVYGCHTPTKKMPDCPNCENDELSMIGKDRIFCNACNVWFEPRTGKVQAMREKE